MNETQDGVGSVRYLVFTWVPEDLLDTWNTWHTEVHVPDVVSTPQIQRARKCRLVDSSLPLDWQPQYVTIYDLDSLRDFESYVAGPGVALRQDYAEHYGQVGKIARLVLTEEAAFDQVE
jgi:hypothetical protein